MIQGGMLCRSCSPAECIDCPSKLETLEIECPECNGKECENCDHTGHFELTDCPNKFIDPNLIEMIEYADLYKKGLPPIAGGALDQSHWFVDAARFLWSEQNRVESEVMK